ncbi:hypothetical protein HV326_00545 [Enterobacter hormaechei]|uniref:hypothetical protein n=1 Tax=Enterobacter hormaechei TaxID=158836 RepID=UPI001252AC23|nr:hypothetical protein [Enterobacter hormaechei]QLS08529.1 hypothetical protein HV326_00545 [Enterobacter hormaechei]VAG63793.1 Uncharacterised protein [Enterobacter hormaechei]
MPKVSNEQKAVMDILDLIHFHNVYTSRLISSEDQKLFQDIALDVQDAVNKISTEEALLDILTHYLICGLEISLSGDDVKFMSKLKGKYEIPDEVLDSVLKKKKEISFALLSCMVSEHGIKKADFIDQLVNLTKKYEGIYIPATIAYRLTLNFNGFFHPFDHLHFYGYLNDLGITACAKYCCDNNNNNNNNNNKKNSFIRVALLMEFEIFRNFASFCINPGGINEIKLMIPPKDIPDDLRNQIIDDYKYLIENVSRREGIIYKFKESNLNNESSVLLLLKNVSRLFRYKRIFHGTMAKWPGTWGSFLIELLLKENPERAIYREDDNSGSASEEASEIMSILGVRISARTLYLRYKYFREKELKNIKAYSYALSRLPYIPEWEQKNNI